MKDEKKKIAEKIRCDMCKRFFSPDELKQGSCSNRFLCPDCYAEENSCGCSDE